MRAKVGHLRCGCLGLDWREGLEVWNLLAWQGAQSSQEGNVEDRRANEKHGVEGTGSWNNVAGTFPSSLNPKILRNTGVSTLPRILLPTPLCCWCMQRVTNPRCDILGSCRWQRPTWAVDVPPVRAFISGVVQLQPRFIPCRAVADGRAGFSWEALKCTFNTCPCSIHHPDGVVEDYAIPFSCRTFVGCSGLMCHHLINSDVVFYFYTTSLCNSAIFHCVS